MRGGATVKLPGGVFVGIDFGERDTYCEMRREKDGTYTILDCYELPREAPKPKKS